MKLTKTTLAMTAALGATLAAVPAAAQVNGIATADRALAIANAQALQTGYQQIADQNQAQLTTLQQLQQQRDVIVKGFDTDGNGQLTEAEANAAPESSKQQVRTLDEQISAAQLPIQRARLYVLTQVAQQYAPAVQQVIADRSIQVMLAPDAIIYAPENADVTQAVTAAINTRAPSVAIAPAADWQPTQAAAQLYQEIQQLMYYSALQQQAAAQQQSAQPQAPAQPTGR
tara:strand:+ start:449 stop:1135 length:687 start_codon:yes stop_codon:yes gene_type:complete